MRNPCFLLCFIYLLFVLLIQKRIKFFGRLFFCDELICPCAAAEEEDAGEEFDAFNRLTGEEEPADIHAGEVGQKEGNREDDAPHIHAVEEDGNHHLSA